MADAMAYSSQHVSAGGGGRFTVVYRPLDEESQHLAKGGAAEHVAREKRLSIHKHPRQKRRESQSTGDGTSYSNSDANTRSSLSSYRDDSSINTATMLELEGGASLYDRTNSLSGSLHSIHDVDEASYELA